MTAKPWIPEREVDAALARRLIADRFPAVRVERIAVLGEGWDNIAYLVNGELVFRFPRRDVGARCMEAEIAVLPQLGALPLEVPRLAWIGGGADDYPWAFAGYRMLRGRTACQVRLDDVARTRAAPILAAFLRTLHAQQLETPPGRVDKLALEPITREAAERLRALDDAVDAAALIRILERTTKGERTTTTLIHGDLYVRHLLVEGVELSGVIDWGDVARGDPAVDLSIGYGFLPPAAREAFFRAYGEVSDETLALARFRAIHIGAALATYGREVGDADLVREGLLALRYCG